MKKMLAMLLTGAMVFSLAACGNSSSGNAPAQSSSSSGESAEAESEPAGSPVTLNVTTTYAGEDTNAGNYQDAIAAWQEETGNKINDASASSAETFKARVISDFEMGSEPDVLFYFNGVDSNPFVEAGKVVSIEEIREVYPDYASNMKDGMMGASPADGKNYSVPVNGYWEGLFVNKAVCEAADVDIPTADTTWDEFMEICQKVKDAGYTPIAASFAEIPHYWFEFCIYNYLTPATHNVLPGSVDDDHGKAWVNGISDMKVLYENGFLPENTLSATDGETFQLFIDGKAAFLIDGSGDANAYYQELGLDIDPGTEAGFRTHYTTRYLIWANEAAKTVLGSDFSGEGPTVSPCYLMNLAFQQMGWQGSAYLQAMDAFSGTFPVVTTNGCYVVDGVFSDAVPQEREARFQDFLSLQYYWRNQFLFGE